MENCRLSDSVTSVFNFKSFCIYIETLSFVYLYIFSTEQMRLEGISGDCPVQLLCWSYKSLIGLSVCKDRLSSLPGWCVPMFNNPHITSFCPFSCYWVSLRSAWLHRLYFFSSDILKPWWDPPQSPLHSNLTSACSLGLTGGMCQPFNQLNHFSSAGPLPASILFNVLFWAT